MIWLIWRQYRVILLLGAVALIALSIIFVQDANMLNAALQQHYYVKCYDPNFLPCGMIIPGTTWPWRVLAATLLPFIPLIIGVFIGAPLLAREYDQHTQILVWTQSISPTRWLSAKIALLGGAVLLFFGGLSIVTAWWGPVQDTIAESPWNTFFIRGSVPVAEALFCLLCGIMIGTFVRRLLPAMALTALLLLLVQGILSISYPYLLPPLSQIDYYNNLRQQHLLGIHANYSQDLLLSVKYVGPDGKIIENVNCIGLVGPYIFTGGSIREINGVQQCLDEHHARPLVEYQRFNEQFWPLQFVITALLLSLTVLVTIVTYWQLQRRLL